MRARATVAYLDDVVNTSCHIAVGEVAVDDQLLFFEQIQGHAAVQGSH